MDTALLKLQSLFDEINGTCFGGLLPLPQLSWNSRLRTTAGRFAPGRRKLLREIPPRIEIASYLLEEENGLAIIKDTLAHEMIHYWLWFRRRPHGHTAEFYAKMNELGVSRYNTVPRHRPYKYLYSCPSCMISFPARKRLRAMACRACCDKHTGGRYDKRFRLVAESTES